MVGVQQWAEVRRLHFVRGLSIREIHRRTGLHRDTIRSALKSDEAPRYSRAPSGSKLDPFKDEIHRLLRDGSEAAGAARPRADRASSASRAARRSSMTTCARCGRCSRRRRGRFSGRSIGPGEVCQFDLWEPRAEVPVGHGQTRRAGSSSRAWATRAPARARWSSPSRRRICWPGSRAVCGRWGRCRETLVWDRQAGIHGHGGRPSEEFAAFCGQLKVDWQFCAPADPQAKGVVERLQDFIERSFEPGPGVRERARLPAPARHAGSPSARTSRHHKTLRCRPVDRLLEERELMAPLPAAAPDTDRRWVLRVPPDPHLRFDTCDYSLDPGLVGRRVEVRVTPTEVLGGRAGHRRARLPPPAQLRQAPDGHRSRARASAAGRPRGVGAGGRDPAAWRAMTR